jgi:holo-[acyl-carrier protein] synthase
MSIYGIGLDIVQVDRMERSIKKYGDKFSGKILHPNEVQIFDSIKNKARYLAKRFAAKEAFAKALGTGIIEGVTLPKIEVINDQAGKPLINLHGTTKLKVEEIGIQQIFLSISDEKAYAVAQVILES